MPQPGQTTIALADLRTDVRQRTDTENDPHITDAELNRWIRTGVAALYDALITMFGEDYFVATPSQLTTDGQSQLYPLPPDLYKILMVEQRNSFGVSVGGQQPAWITVLPFQMREKNRYNLLTFPSYFGYVNMRYRLSGSNIMFVPVPQGGQVLQLWYAPRLVPLADTGYVALAGVVAGDALTINGVTFTAVASGAVGPQFNVGATDAATASNLAAAIVAAAVPGVVTAIAGPTNSATAYFGAEGPLQVPARPTLPANVVAVTIYNATVTWFASGSHLALSPGPQGAQASTATSPTTYTWSDVLDSLSEWWELAACDAALKVLGKQERDASVVVAARALVKDRLDRSAPNRNLGDPSVISETQTDYPFLGPGSGFWPGGV